MSSRLSPVARLRVRLQVEELEPRNLLAAPSAIEQVFLERLNDARANPAAYGVSIGLNLSGVAASQPLAFDSRLNDAALGHSRDMNARAYFAHNTPEGLSPGDRLTAAGFPWTSYGESIAAGFPSPESALSALIIDNGIDDLGHRRHLLAIDSLFKDQKQVGIGIVLNGSGPYGSYYTIDSAATGDSRPFLTGVVYNDLNRNGRYDAGEGLGSATVTIAGVGSIGTSASGAYSLRLNPGSYTVSASGGGLPGVVMTTITVGAANGRINFTTTGAVGGGTFPGLAASARGSGTTGVIGSGQIYVTGADAGAAPQVNVYDARTGQLKASFFATSPSFTGGIRVAVGDVTGDGIADVICGAGPGGGPQVTVFDGATFQPIRSFFATSPSFTGGVFVAAGDVNGDGFADIICGADAGGGPQVSVFDGRTNTILTSFYATVPSFTGGVRVAAGDVNGDGRADIIASAGRGGGPQVSIFDGRTFGVLASFYATTPSFSGGVFVAAGDVNGDGRADVIAGAGPGGGPQVTLFDGRSLSVLNAFFALTPSFTGGVRVAAIDIDGDGRSEILAGAGPGGGPQASIFDSFTLRATSSFFAYAPAFTGGVWLGAI